MVLTVFAAVDCRGLEVDARIARYTDFIGGHGDHPNDAFGMSGLRFDEFEARQGVARRSIANREL